MDEHESPHKIQLKAFSRAPVDSNPIENYLALCLVRSLWGSEMNRIESHRCRRTVKPLPQSKF